METVRIKTSTLSGDERFGILAAGYIELRDGPDPAMNALRDGPWRVVDVGPDWVDIERY